MVVVVGTSDFCLTLLLSVLCSFIASVATLVDSSVSLESLAVSVAFGSLSHSPLTVTGDLHLVTVGF